MDAVTIIELHQLNAMGDKGAVARHPQIHLTPALAMELAMHDNPMVRKCLAYNPAIGAVPDSMKVLARDEDHDIRGDLAMNPAIANCPDVAMQLAVEQPWSRRYLAENTAIAELPKLAKFLSRDKDLARTIAWTIENLPEVKRRFIAMREAEKWGPIE